MLSLIHIFCDVVLINKTDVLPYFDFDMEKCRENIRMRNPNARVCLLYTSRCV